MTLSNLKIVSHLPAISFELDNKFWIAAGAQWIEVDRVYTPEELKTIWVKEEPKYKYVSAKEELKSKTFKISGSKGNVYTVKNKGGKWSCNCPSSTFRSYSECKHIKQAKSK